MGEQQKHLLSHAAIYLLARGVPGVIAFLAIPLFSRLLAPAQYGRYALVVATVGLLNALLFQWTRLSLVRYLPAYSSDASRLKSTLLVSTFTPLLALGLIGGAFVLLPAARDWRTLVGPCWLILAAQAMFELCCEHARAGIRPWHYMVLQLTRSITAVALGVGLVLLGMGWWGPLLGTGIGMTLGVGYAWRRDWAGVRWTIDRAVLHRVLGYGIPLSLTVALTAVIGTSDRFLIALFRGEDAAGLYSVAFDFTSQTLTLLMMVVYMAVFPLAVRAWEQQGPQAAREQMRANAALLLAVGVPCVVGISLLAPGIARLFLGESFRAAAAQIMPLVALSALVAGIKAYHFDAAFQFVQRTLDQVWIVLVAAIINVALNLIAIPRWGINGSAAASALSFLIAMAMTAWIGRRRVALPFPAAAVGQVLLASAAMAAVLYPLRGFQSPLAVIVQMSGGVVVYGLVLLSSDFLGLRGAILRKWTRGAKPPPVAAAAGLFEGV
jgi:O-antigen/teichoic acid export membrane protein